MTVNCILSGVGGQGTVLASKLIAQAAMDKGQNARTAETIGMAQRGGCVVSHVRIGDKIHSPMIPKHSADVIIGFEPAEAVRCLPYLKKGGVVVVSRKAIRPVTTSLGESSYNGSEMIACLQKEAAKLIVVDGEKICEDCGSAKVLNVALLGAACASGMLGLSMDELKNAISKRVKPQFIEINSKALEKGAQAAEMAEPHHT
ncbi:MAG: indolepyruvate oxidoreductase subunit beta [Clostridiales bacterium]|jgi:indolepyruvate ferredoxin oxidoreductase beta subunit|nr:indolepyruvate oxidoreductase subunit beta [Clostridiales bacterium]